MEELFEYIDNIKITNRASAVPSSYRITYKVSQILLIMNLSCGARKGCSLEKLQMIIDAAENENYMKNLKKFIDKEIDVIIIRYDPSLNRALIYALAEGLITVQKNKLYKLTNDGKLYIEKIKNEKDIYIREKEVLGEIKEDLTEDRIKTLMNDWRLEYVENK